MMIAPDGPLLRRSTRTLGSLWETLDAGQVKEYKLHVKNNGVYLFVIDRRGGGCNTSPV